MRDFFSRIKYFYFSLKFVHPPSIYSYYFQISLKNNIKSQNSKECKYLTVALYSFKINAEIFSKVLPKLKREQK